MGESAILRRYKLKRPGLFGWGVRYASEYESQQNRSAVETADLFLEVITGFLWCLGCFGLLGSSFLHDTGQQGVGLGPGALNFWSEGLAESLFQSPRQRRSNGTVVGLCDSVATVATAKVLYNRD